jgi:hypothetical protein
VRAEVIWLRNGDRLTGTIVSETARAVRLKMPFATLLIPRSRIERLVRADGKQEVLHPPAGTEAAASPAPPPVPATRLSLVVTGASFWQAWDRREAPPDPTLRLEVRIDEEPVASWTDARLDPEDLPGAIVNTFAFASGDEAGVTTPGVLLAAPEVQPGRVLLRMELPGVGEDRRLRVAYQTNQATTASPAWRDAASATIGVNLRPDAPAIVQVRQERGRMEFAGFPRKKMRGVETFRIELSTE